MAKKQFKAESKRLMDLMINSIYTHKEIFLREIISNASDAEDKLAYRALTDDSVEVKRKDLKITIVPDKEKRTLTVSDNGVGMTKDVDVAVRWHGWLHRHPVREGDAGHRYHHAHQAQRRRGELRSVS